MGLDPSSSHGNGGSQTHTREKVTGASSVLIADDGQANLTFAHQAGDALLDYTDPGSPSVIDAGMYAIMALPICDDGVQASGYMDVTLAPTGSFELAGIDDEENVDLTLGVFPITGLHLTVYMEAGDTFSLICANRSGIGPLHFSVNVGLVQRIY